MTPPCASHWASCERQRRSKGARRSRPSLQVPSSRAAPVQARASTPSMATAQPRTTCAPLQRRSAAGTRLPPHARLPAQHGGASRVWVTSPITVPRHGCARARCAGCACTSAPRSRRCSLARVPRARRMQRPPPRPQPWPQTKLRGTYSDRTVFPVAVDVVTVLYGPSSVCVTRAARA